MLHKKYIAGIMDKKAVSDIWMTIFKLVIAGLIIIFILWLIVRIFSSGNQGTTQRYHDLVNRLMTMEDNESEVFNAWQIDSSYGEYGFNIDPQYVYIENENNPIKKPRQKCGILTACICLCDKQCDKVYECNTLPGISYFVVYKDFKDNYGKDPSTDDRDFKDWEFLAAIGEYKGQGFWKVRWDQNKFGIQKVNISRSGDTLYFLPCTKENNCISD
jgi:hypothetical protein